MHIEITMASGEQFTVPARLVPDAVLQGSDWRPGIVLEWSPLGDELARESIEMAASEGSDLSGDDFSDPEERDGPPAWTWRVVGTHEDWCRSALLRWSTTFFDGGEFDPAMGRDELLAVLPEELYGVSEDEICKEFLDDQKVWAFYLDDPQAELRQILSGKITALR